jgi:hypothetical protein
MLLASALGLTKATVNDAVGRLLFPRVHRRVRERKMRALGIGLSVGAAAALLFGILLWMLNKPDPVQRRQYPPGLTPPANAVGTPAR